MADPAPPPPKPAAQPKTPSGGKPPVTPTPSDPLTTPLPTTIPGVVWLREWTTTAIAGIVVVVTMAILVVTFLTPDITFQDRKDVLTLVLPILGSIIGYYFGRVPAERRAEAAEGNLDNAQATADKATVAASQAHEHAAEKDRKLDIAKKGLKQVQKTTAGAGGKKGRGPAPEGAGGGGDEPADAAARAHLVASTVLGHLDG